MIWNSYFHPVAHTRTYVSIIMLELARSFSCLIFVTVLPPSQSGERPELAASHVSG